MNKRNENNKVTWNEIMYSVEFFCFLAISAILTVKLKSNYFFLSCFALYVITVFESGDIHFYKNKLTKFIFRNYAWTVKIILKLMLFISIILSWHYFKAFICSIVLSVIWTEYMKLFKRRKCPKLGF